MRSVPLPPAPTRPIVTRSLGAVFSSRPSTLAGITRGETTAPVVLKNDRLFMAGI
ncbi:hypothetical protein OAF65_05235 [Verrucomicrobiales bacterium]|nr:hypothetical protein [Verrucomicrobiales bacterium]